MLAPFTSEIGRKNEVVPGLVNHPIKKIAAPLGNGSGGLRTAC